MMQPPFLALVLGDLGDQDLGSIFDFLNRSVPEKLPKFSKQSSHPLVGCLMDSMSIRLVIRPDGFLLRENLRVLPLGLRENLRIQS